MPTVKILFIIFSALAVAFLLHRLVYSQKKINLAWPLLVFGGIFILLYAVNPQNRIYSFHGFLHTGIVYQILEGGLPPTNVLLAGEKLLYPWGYEFVCAQIVRIFNITPFYTFALVNIVSLLLVEQRCGL